MASIEFPDALSIDEHHPHYRADWHAIAAVMAIYLDGEKQRFALAYDVNAGSITRYVSDAKGIVTNIVGEAQIETVSGKVELRHREDLD